ncbi:hypothetical protein PVAG01_02070 [Phlyctema vagabunda]|uniref:Zn(2)-C6 fungal-type domain-containing protein n=1 Tax=Phlyctema vagabunda TaxID=108571 RepID=A0ABR4PPJ5_9HELO
MDPGRSASVTPPHTSSFPQVQGQAQAQAQAQLQPQPRPSLPVRHRRRPALSCVLCRQRKVKCDRNAPCRQCINSGNKNCTYSSSSRVVSPAPAPPVDDGSSSSSGIKVRPAAPGVIVFNSVPAAEVNGSDDLEKRSSLLSSKARLESTASKIKFMGHSHWSAGCEYFDVVRTYIWKQDEEWSEVQGLVKQCKAIIKAIRSSVKAEQLICFDPKDCLPSRELCDELVGLYLRTFETTLRILHIPSFWTKYQAHWNNPQSSSPTFIIKLLLVLAVGAAFYQPPHPHLSRSLIMSWIFTAKSWIQSSADDTNLNIAFIQIQCLLVVARQCNDISTHGVPILTSTLLRTAMMIGLHRDPSLFGKLRPYDREIRKRLWATVLELAVQSSPDSGMPPFISLEDYDCPPPSNLNDDEFDESTSKQPASHPANILTQSSWQIALLKSMPTRIAITKLVESLHSDPSYESILQLSAALTKSYESLPPFLHLHESSSDAQGAQPSSFQKYLLDLCTRRFLLYLHHPFSILSRENPQYYFSRKISLESSLVLLSYPTDTDEDIARLRNAGGMYKMDFFHACTSIFIELHLRATDSSFLGPASTELSQPLFSAVQKFVAWSRQRVSSAHDNVKGYFLHSLLYAQFRGDDMKQVALDVAGFSLNALRDKLDSMRSQKSNQMQINTMVAVGDPAQAQAPLQQNLSSVQIPDVPMNLDLPPMDFSLTPTTGDLNSLNWIFDEWDDTYL